MSQFFGSFFKQFELRRVREIIGSVSDLWHSTIFCISTCEILCLIHGPHVLHCEAFPVRLLPRLGISSVTPDSGPVTGGRDPIECR